MTNSNDSAPASDLPSCLVFDERGDSRPCAAFVRGNARFEYTHPLPDDATTMIVRAIQKSSGHIAQSPFYDLACMGLPLALFGVASIGNVLPFWLRICIAIVVSIVLLMIWQRRAMRGYWDRYPDAHKHELLAAGFCPWCCRTLREGRVNTDGMILCTDCDGHWRLPDQVESTRAARRQREHILASNFGIGMLVLALGTLAAAMSMTEPWPAVIVSGVATAICAIAAWKTRILVPVAMAGVFVAPFLVMVILSTVRGAVPGPLASLCIAVVFGTALYAIVSRMHQPTRRSVRRGIGTQCASCHYDLIKTPEGQPCPECGGMDRVSSA